MTENKIGKEDIYSINGGNYIVNEEEKNGKEMFYRLNIYSGFCECGKGKNCGPCKHKNAVAHHFQVSGFCVLPETDPHMQEMWHYITFGKTLENHWYRRLHDGKETSIDVETFISERLENPSDISTEETDVFFETETEPADQNSDNE